MKNFLRSTAGKLIISIFVGIAIGYAVKALPEAAMSIPLQILLVAKHITSQIILFIVPMIIFGCVAPSIAGFQGNVTKVLGLTVGIAYLSSIGAATLAIAVAWFLVPVLVSGAAATTSTTLPDPIIAMNFPTMDTMSALLLAILIGLGVVWVGKKKYADALQDFQTMTLAVVKNVIIPILPVFVAANFALLVLQGKLAQMAVFLPAVLIVIACHLLWLALLYGIATVYSKRNGWNILRNYVQAYLTAVGTMSSAATLPVALECMGRSKTVSDKTAGFALPLFCNIHLCGGCVSELFFVITTYYMLYGALPDFGNLCVFAVLACVIAIGAPGVPGGLNMSCAALVGSVILGGQDIATFFGIMTAVYTIVDGFGTAANITGDGALALITDAWISRNNPDTSPQTE